MKKLLPFLSGYKKECILAPLFKMLEACFDLLVPMVMASIIDAGIGSNDKPYILRMCGVLVLLGLIGLGCSITAQFFAARAAVGFSTRLRHEVFRHVQSLSYTEMDTQGTSTLITRLTSDINQVQGGVNLALRLLLRSPFVVLGALIMALRVNVQAALVFVVVIPLLAMVVFGIMAWTLPRYKTVQAALDAVLTVTRENLTGVRVIRAFNLEKSEEARFDSVNTGLASKQIFVGRVSGLMNPLTFVIINLGIVVLLNTGAVQVNLGGLTQGQVIALVNYMNQVLVELVKLANMIVQTTKALACADRVSAVLDLQCSQTAPAAPVLPTRADGLVEFDHVSLTYATAGEESLTDINLKALPGQTIGIIGGTGSGKSSVVSLIPRFYDATAGRVLVDGQPVQEYAPTALRGRIGVVPQKALLFAGTIRDNLRWGKPDATDEELWAALETAQGAEVVRGKAGGLDAVIEQGGKNLSGGQRQRLTIARALVRRPEILILDDSASALDFATDAALRKAIRALDPPPTTFIVSQRASSIQYADNILVLEDGCAVGWGTHAQLLADCPVYKEIYESQFKKPGEV